MEYMTLLIKCDFHEELYPRKLEFALLAWEQPPRNQFDSLYLGTELVNIMMDSGNKKEALKYLSTNMKLDTLDLNNYKLFIEF